MKIKEIIVESTYINPEIKKILTEKGYKYLGSGADQQAYLAPDNTVLKIFGTTKYNGSTVLTKSQKTFKLFADYCMKHQDNPFLPQFYGWETFTFKNQLYLQIKTERLFEFSYSAAANMNYALEELADSAESSNSKQEKERFINDTVNNSDFEFTGRAKEKLFVHLGEDGFNKLWDTIYELGKIAKKADIGLDLHPGNFMLGSDGHIVISDPFYSSGW